MTATNESTAATPAVATPAAVVLPAAACRNCGSVLQGDFCHRCGQPLDGLVREFPQLAADVVDSLAGWDGRTPRTLWPLFARPGFLTREYVAGRRVRYVAPVRLFYLLAILAFFVGSLVVSFGSGIEAGDRDIGEATTVAEVERLRDATLAGLVRTRRDLPNVPGADAGVIAAEIRTRLVADSRIVAIRQAEASGEPLPKPGDGLSFGAGEWDPQTNPVRVSWLPAFANDWLNRQTARSIRNVERLQEDPEQFKSSLMGAVPVAMSLLLPVFALMLKLLYLFRRRLYMEHLVFALHSHAFVCLVLLALFVLEALRGAAAVADPVRVVAATLEAMLWVWMPLYLLLMQKRVYGQGWPATLLKYCVLGLGYSVLLSIAAALTTVASLLWM